MPSCDILLPIMLPSMGAVPLRLHFSGSRGLRGTDVPVNAAARDHLTRVSSCPTSSKNEYEVINHLRKQSTHSANKV